MEVEEATHLQKFRIQRMNHRHLLMEGSMVVGVVDPVVAE